MKFTYNDKLNTISDFFGVSIACSKYMYHRRRKGHPYKKKEDGDYLEWSIQLQNGLIAGDLSGIDYKNLKFNKDIDELKNKYNIDISKLSKEKIEKNKIMQNTTKMKRNDEISDHIEDNEWSIITPKKSLNDKKKILKQIGFYIDL